MEKYKSKQCHCASCVYWSLCKCHINQLSQQKEKFKSYKNPNSGSVNWELALKHKQFLELLLIRTSFNGHQFEASYFF
jgi:hypothetical protein